MWEAHLKLSLLGVIFSCTTASDVSEVSSLPIRSVSVSEKPPSSEDKKKKSKRLSDHHDAFVHKGVVTEVRKGNDA